MGAIYLLRAQAVRPRPAGPLPHRRVLTVPRTATTTPHPFKPNRASGEPGRGQRNQRREIGPPPTGHRSPTAVSRHPSHQRPLPEPLPGLLWRDLVVQAHEVKQISGTPPGIAVPMRGVTTKNLKTGTHIPPIMMLLKRTRPDPL